MGITIESVPFKQLHEIENFKLLIQSKLIPTRVAKYRILSSGGFNELARSDMSLS